jgi:hypothetical protein
MMGRSYACGSDWGGKTSCAVGKIELVGLFKLQRHYYSTHPNKILDIKNYSFSID